MIRHSSFVLCKELYPKEQLPDGLDLEVINGGSHVVMIEKPYYHDFQDRLVRFLEK